MNRGLLLTMTEPPPAMEEEFNAWYDTEHLAERLSIPGFFTAQRWVADVEPGEGKYLGTYELASASVLTSKDYLKHFENQTPWSRRCLAKCVAFRRSPGVLETPEYLAYVGDNFTPWSKRCLGAATVFRRWACEQIVPGTAPQSAAPKALFLAIGDTPPEHEAEFNKWYNEEHLPMLARVPGVLSARRFFDPKGKPRYIAMYELSDPDARSRPEWQAAITTPWTRRIDELTDGCEWILRLYRAYRAYTPQK
jgi:hypothetical protein